MDFARGSGGSRQLLAVPILLRFQGGAPARRGEWKSALQSTYLLLAAAERRLSRNRGGRSGVDRAEELGKLRARLSIVWDAMVSLRPF